MQRHDHSHAAAVCAKPVSPHATSFKSQLLLLAWLLLPSVVFDFAASILRCKLVCVQSCAVDPGAVSSNIYANSRLPGPIRWFIRNLHAPTKDGASAAIHAATAPWQEPVLKKGQQYRPRPSELRV